MRPNEKHINGCDIERCSVCGLQAIECNHTETEKWSGLWPGIKECYEHKLLSYYWVDELVMIEDVLLYNTQQNYLRSGIDIPAEELLIIRPYRTPEKDLNPKNWNFDLNTYIEKKYYGKL